MTSNKLLVFDIAAEYGHFRKFNTTSSPLTYAFPPRPTIAGLLGAILGIERETSGGVFADGVIPVNELFDIDKSRIALQIIDPIKKTQIGFNLLNTKNNSSFFNITNRTQVEYELLKNPKYRLFVWHEEEAIYNNLKERLVLGNHHFTPYLGLAQMTAKVSFVDECPFEIRSNADFIDCLSVLNTDYLVDGQAINFHKDGFYAMDTYPLSMQSNREITRYSEILIEKLGNKGTQLQVKPVQYAEVKGIGNIVFL